MLEQVCQMVRISCLFATTYEVASNVSRYQRPPFSLFNGDTQLYGSAVRKISRHVTGSVWCSLSFG